MPGKCKFQDSWLSKVIYKDWLMKDTHDIHFARCRACCKSIKLQTMGEAALTSHAGGAGHKAAVRKLMEGSEMTNSAGRMNGGEDQDDDSKVFLQDGVAVGDRQHSPDENSTSHNAELQDGTFVAAPGRSISGLISQRLHWSGDEAEEASQQQQQQQQQQMKILEWESRMKVLALEQELLREKRKAAQQKWRAFRLKKAYYKAKLKRLGEGLPPSSPNSSSDEGEEKTPGPTG